MDWAERALAEAHAAREATERAAARARLAAERAERLRSTLVAARERIEFSRERIRYLDNLLSLGDALLKFDGSVKA